MPAGRAARGFRAVLWGALLLGVGACSANLPTYDPFGARELPGGTCEADVDCARGACDPDSHACVACLRSADCHDAALRCVNEQCVPRATDCNADADCHAPPAGGCYEEAGHCRVGEGVCDYTPRSKGAGCEDGDHCTSGDSCDGQGACVAGAALACDDHNPCTSDRCEPGSGCVHENAPEQQSCGGNGEVCAHGVCQCGRAQSETNCTDGTDNDCNGKSDCADSACAGQGCDDGDPCTTGETCRPDGSCGAGTRTSCAAPPNEQCFTGAGTCDESTGKCTYVPKNKGDACDDGDACTSGETCDGQGSCGSGQPLACNTPPAGGCWQLAGTCDRSSGRCMYVPKNKGEACDDGSACTTGETCDGQGSCGSGQPLTCPSAPGLCAQAGQCNPATGTCEYLPSAKGTVCRKAAGACDAEELCDGVSLDCPADRYQPSTVVCRAALPGTGAASCDVAESCTGSSPDCPADKVVAAGYVCRPSQGLCDAEERCDGTNDVCPADAFLPSSITCRPAKPGVNGAASCDVAEQCTGTSAQCPSDAFVARGSLCRKQAGECDVAEQCTGASPDCPGDVLVPAGVGCGGNTNPCINQACTGTSALCPSPKQMPNGECCNSDPRYSCQSGQCMYSPFILYCAPTK